MFVTADKIAPWDKPDQCAECGVLVVYDSRDSEGKPHICMPCAYLYRASFLSPGTPLEELAPDIDSLGDDEIVRRMDATRAQNAGRENENAGPTRSPAHKYAARDGFKRAYRV